MPFGSILALLDDRHQRFFSFTSGVGLTDMSLALSNGGDRAFLSVLTFRSTGRRLPLEESAGDGCELKAGDLLMLDDIAGDLPVFALEDRAGDLEASAGLDDPAMVADRAGVAVVARGLSGSSGFVVSVRRKIFNRLEEPLHT